MINFARTLVSLVVICLLLGLALPIAAQDHGPTVEPIVTVQYAVWLDGSRVEDSEAILTRLEHGLSMSLETSGLVPGDAYTVWWTIFDVPQNCSDGVCGPDDVFLTDDTGQFVLDENGERLFNFASIEAAQISTMRATGAIAYDDGTAYFRAHLPIGDMTDDPIHGTGLHNAMSAEVHLIVRTHGPAQQDVLTEQLFTLAGGCLNAFTLPCDVSQFAFFPPPTSPE